MPNVHAGTLRDAATDPRSHVRQFITLGEITSFAPFEPSIMIV